MEMPAQYMFKDIPTYDEIDDPLELVLAEMERFGITRFLTNVTEKDLAKRALTDHPDKFWGILNVDPNTGHGGAPPDRLPRSRPGATSSRRSTRGARRCSRRCRSTTRRCTRSTPSAWRPGCRSWSTQACPVLGCPCVRSSPIQLDEVCWFFPELKIVTRHGAEPWTELMVKLLLKWPNLYYSTSAFAPKHYPQDIIDFANTRGADKIIFAGYWAAGLTLDRIFAELPQVPFRDHVGGSSSAKKRRAGVQARGSPVTSNVAFDAALAGGGAIDTAVGVPKSREEMFQFYSFIRDQAKGRRVQVGRRRSRHARGYMFKQGSGRDDELGDPVELLMAEHAPLHPPGDRLGGGRGGRLSRCVSTGALLRVDRRQSE